MSAGVLDIALTEQVPLGERLAGRALFVGTYRGEDALHAFMLRLTPFETNALLCAISAARVANGEDPSGPETWEGRQREVWDWMMAHHRAEVIPLADRKGERNG